MYLQFLYFSLFLVYISTCFGWQGYEHELMKNLPTQSPEIGETFIWQTDNNLKIPTNWENNDIPCDDDKIRMDADKEIVAMVEDGLRATRWELPNDGIILFADKTVIGRKGTWQCQRRKSPEDVFYVPPGILGNFLDVSKWKLASDTRQRPRLHSEMVPSQEDEAIFPSEHAFQVQIDQIVAVKKLIYNDQIQTSDSLFNKMLTIEGQYIFQLGPGRRVDRNFDGIEYKYPREMAVKVDEIPYNKAGNKNWNSKAEVLKDLCSFYSCPVYPEKFCTNLIKPDGHCCHTCVARMEFRQHSLNFAEAKLVLEQVEKDLIYHTDMGIRLTRLDDNEAFPLYQLVVFPEEPENYDESLFYSALNSAFWMIQWRMQQLLNVQPHYTTPKIEYSYQRGKIRASMVFIFLAVLLILGSGSYFVFRYEYQHNYRFRIWFDNSETVNQMSVVWQQARNYAEERVDVLLNHSVKEEVPTSFAPEDLETPESGAVQEVVQTEFSNQAFLNDVPEETEEVQPTEENLIDIDF